MAVVYGGEAGVNQTVQVDFPHGEQPMLDQLLVGVKSLEGSALAWLVRNRQQPLSDVQRHYGVSGKFRLTRIDRNDWGIQLTYEEKTDGTA